MRFSAKEVTDRCKRWWDLLAVVVGAIDGEAVAIGAIDGNPKCNGRRRSRSWVRVECIFFFLLVRNVFKYIWKNKIKLISIKWWLIICVFTTVAFCSTNMVANMRFSCSVFLYFWIFFNFSLFFWFYQSFFF